MKAILLLEDGSVFEGTSIGAAGERFGRVVLNTGVVGYQEMMTDPTNAGKILVLTYPLIGNYGAAGKFYESARCWISGLAIKESSRMHSNWQAEGPFEDFVKREDVVAISDIDTRTLAITIRDKGELFAAISTKNTSKTELLKKLKNYKDSETKDRIKDISTKSIKKIDPRQRGPDIAVLDLGMLNSFIKQLKTLGCNITLLPYDTPGEKISAMRFDALVISNGPEDDVAIPRVAGTVKELLGKIPIFGISTGHEVIGLALGAKIKRMTAGHHGVNYPVRPPDSYKGEITVQNHSFVVDENSIKRRKDVTITQYNLNDNTIEEMSSKSLKFISTQYYPASPGFDEVNEAWGRFLKMVGPNKNPKQKLAMPSCSEVQNAKA